MKPTPKSVSVKLSALYYLQKFLSSEKQGQKLTLTMYVRLR